MAGKKVCCDCGKTIRGGTEEELIRDVQRHAQEAHKMDLSREQVLAMAEPG